MYLFVLFTGLCYVFAEEVILDDTTTSFTWKNTDSATITIKALDGYQIQVDINQLDVDGEHAEYVKVQSLSDNDEEEDYDDGLMFTYTVNEKPSYLYNTNQVLANYIGENENNTFEILFTRVGEATTTTPVPDSTSTTQLMPTAAPEESSTLTVYLYGQAAAQYQDKQIKSLQKNIAVMGTQYCNVQNCPLNGSITFSNVKIKLLQQCPILWENYESCVNLTFALPILKPHNYKNTTLWDGYQLSESHLKLMWNTYAEDQLKLIGLTLYSEPNINLIFTNKLLIICFVIAAMVILILITRHFITKINKRRRKHSDTYSIMNHPSNRQSQLSLTPHFLQELPPLFTNDFPLNSEQRNKPYSEFNSNFSDNEPPRSSTPPKILKISRDNPDELEDADA